MFATAGRPDPEPPVALPAAEPFVAMAVGNTKEGESLPAKPVAYGQQVGEVSIEGVGVPSFE